MSHIINNMKFNSQLNMIFCLNRKLIKKSGMKNIFLHLQRISKSTVLFFIFLLFYSIFKILGLAKTKKSTIAKTHAAFLHLLVRILNIKIQLTKEDELKLRKISNSALILANHISYLDAIIISNIFKCSGIAKQEVQNWPFIGTFTKSINAEFVDRSNLSSKLALLLRMRKRLQSERLFIFPEGSTSQNLTPLQNLWANGQIWPALQAKSEIILVGICYENQSGIAWIDDMTFLPHFLSILKLQKITAYLSIEVFDKSLMGDKSARLISELSYLQICNLCHSSNKLKNSALLNGSDFTILKECSNGT